MSKVESAQAKGRVAKAKKNKRYSRDAHSAYRVGKKKFQRLSSEGLKNKNMAWTPKVRCKEKNDVQDSVARKIIEVKKGRTEVNKQLSRRSTPAKKYLRLAHHLYSSSMPSMPFVMEFTTRYDWLPAMDLF